MYEQMQLTGGAELERLLIQLPADVEKTILRDALKAGAQPIHQEMVDKCPVSADENDEHQGELKKNLKVRLRTSSRNGTISVLIGTRAGDYKGDQFYAPMVEYGHTIAARKDGKPLRVMIQGQWFTLKPGTKVKAHPFMRPAFDAKKDAALAIVGQEIKSGIERAAAQT